MSGLPSAEDLVRRYREHHATARSPAEDTNGQGDAGHMPGAAASGGGTVLEGEPHTAHGPAAPTGGPAIAAREATSNDHAAATDDHDISTGRSPDPSPDAPHDGDPTPSVAAFDAPGRPDGPIRTGHAKAAVKPPPPAQQRATMPLGAAAAELGLLPRLLAHPTVSPRASPALRTTGVAIASLGLVGLAVERRAVLLGQAVPSVPGGLFYASLGAIVAGVLVWALGNVVPTGRHLHLRLFVSQQDEWLRAVRVARGHKALQLTGIGLWLVGLAAVVVRYHLGGEIPVWQIAAAGLVALIGSLVMFAAWLRQRLVRWAYVQTLVLAWIERSGAFGASGLDADTREVLHGLAGFIRELPEGLRRQFEETDVARELPRLLSR